MNYNTLLEQDKVIYDAILNEADREYNTLELIASENFCSAAVREAAGSILTNKYAEGYSGKRYYGGCEYVDIIEQLAIDRAKELFGAEHANVQPHSGASANLAVQFALLKPGDTIMGMNLSDGGHLTHGHPANISGKYFNIVSYGVDPKTGLIDYDEMYALAKQTAPKMIIVGASAYSRFIDYAKCKEIADSVCAYLMVDMAHVAGLVAAGIHPNPVPFADVVTTTTHKTLRGPRGGIILCKNALAKKIDSAVFPGTQGGPLEHIIAAKAVCLGEAMTDDFKRYATQVVANAGILCETLQEQGIKIVSGGTDNHLMLLDLTNTGKTGKQVQEELESVGITTNKNTIPGETLSPTLASGLRIGTPAVTTRGMNTADMKEIGTLITSIIKDYDANKATVTKKVANLCSRYGSFYNW